jgi:succinate dehydrogenase / fumarate reductase, cytochrome b subunit
MSALLKSLSAFLGSSIGKKLLVALTGAVLVLFVLGHMIGNLLIFAGPDAINEYGHFLQTMLHGAGVWIARAGLLVCAVVHVVLTVQLTRENRAARTQRYGVNATLRASGSSRIMIVSGLTLLAFIIYHLLHFTVHAGNSYGGAGYDTALHGETVHNVYKMVVDGFSWLPATVFYLIAMALLCSHLSHGVSSMFQTLGLATERTQPLLARIGKAYAALILVGNCSIPIAIYLFHYGR